MSISINGFNESILTFKAATGFETTGVPVKMSANNTVSACSESDSFCGISRSFMSGCAAVQVSGAVKVGYSGTAPTVGYNMLAADGSGKVAVAAQGGREYLVVEVNTTSSVATILL